MADPIPDAPETLWDCPACGGNGWVVGTGCCGGSEWECGGRGCHGPVMVQECCPDCGGAGSFILTQESDNG